MFNKMNNNFTYEIKEFHPDLIAPNRKNFKNPEQGGSKIVFIGKPGTGKSTLIKYILFAKKNIIPVGIVINGTEDMNNFYSEFFPSLFVFNKYDEKVLQEILDRQERAIKSELSNKWLVIILDDCTYEKKIFDSAVQKYMFLNGRHINILYFIVTQYSVDLPPTLRTCVDGVFVFKETNERNLKILHQNYCGVIPEFNVFKQYMEQITGNFTALYFDSQNQSVKEWHECVYYIKAPRVPNFKFGCKEYRAYSRNRVDKKWLKKKPS